MKQHGIYTHNKNIYLFVQGKTKVSPITTSINIITNLLKLRNINTIFISKDNKYPGSLYV